MKKYYKINEIAKLYNIKTDSLRYYEEVGLICPMRSKSNYRLYTLNDIYILNIIRDCLKLGYDTSQIKEYLDNRSVNNTIAFLKEEEKLIIRQNISGVRPDIKPILTKDEILEARKIVREVYLDEKIERYIVDIVFATRFPQEHGLANLSNMIAFGASPRASINLALAARAYAFIKRRGYVIPEDIRAVCHDVMRHRIGLSYEAEANNLTSEEVISEILNKVEVP